MKCPYCFEKPVEIIELNFTMFRHFGFVDLKKTGVTGRCPHCRLLFNILDAGEIERLDRLYRTPHYAKSGVTHQTFLVPEYNGRVTRSFLQAEILSRHIDTDRPSILDIGCFDGTLLRELKARYPGAALHGFDVNTHLRHFFPSRDNFHFWTSSIEEIEGIFNVISMSHSLMYIRDIRGLLNTIGRLLKPDGAVFVQVPDIRRNPYSLLLGDQYYHYTPVILENIFRVGGFDFSILDNDWFPRDIAAVARPRAGHDAVSFGEDVSIHGCIEALREKKAKLKAMPDGTEFGVLGTTIAAAFVDSILGDRVLFFADENSNSPGRTFRGKKVLHPSSMDKTDCLIIPYGASNEAITERFTRVYGLTHFNTL